MDVLLALLIPALVAASGARDAAAGGPRARTEARLSDARTLVVQMQHLDARAIDRLDPDVLVTDPSRDGSDGGRWTRWEVRRLRWRWGQPDRLALAYLSVGEAEDYRGYWKDAARGGQAPFLDRPNPDWPGNVRVRHWDPAWWRVLRGHPRAELDRLLEAGWDGVFLDTVDACETWAAEGRRDAPARMGDLVVELARYARERRPGFLVVANNPFAVLDRPGVAAALSGVLAEGHLMRGEALAPAADREGVLRRLRDARQRGLAAFAVEYPRSRAGLGRLAALCEDEALTCHAGVRALDRPGTVLRRGRAAGEAP